MFENKFADRIKSLNPSSIRKIMAIAKELIAQGKTVYELNIGQPDIECIPEFAEAISRRAQTGQINYSPYVGEKYLRETYARYLNSYFDRRKVSHLVIDTDNVLVTVGASQALNNAFLAICNPGDEVLAIEPFFTPYSGFLGVAGGVIKTISTSAEQNFALPPEDEIEKHITPKTKAIIINSPNNPTGKIYSRTEMECLARVCVKHDIFLISDEVYREMILGEEEAFSAFQIDMGSEEANEKLKNLMIVVDSASKSFSLCGVRIGFLIARKPIIDRICLVTAHTVACVSDLAQYGVASAYDAVLARPDYLNQLRRTYRERLEATMEAIDEFLPDVVAPRPAGAFYIMVKFPGFEDITEFCYFMLEKFNMGGETVAVTPAGDFYPNSGHGRNEIRIALVVSPEKMRRSIQIISEALRAFKGYKANQVRPML
ncbi:MAG TPA: aminotransferase class I/II-fold pyridoxal phosphate-dependent enzyme [Candidatus Rifleibacterium sp.]|nr:aminotransferase class I/II-fold pyridoxal phosphate-dependent enzyme [Candidatus Rifleibacterium sp.]HPT46709.1 aminotransferase class I/II-fold pyridoxal phosphate-dependent enzyme [Candidatus Rifleibacterium sp.]